MLRLIVPILALGTAAPPPKELPGDRITRFLGEKIDPVGDCRFLTTPTGMRIAIPATPHRFGRTESANKAPRTARAVEGDFTFEIRITQPVPRPAVEGVTTAGAGVYLWVGNQHFLTTRRSFEQVDSIHATVRTEARSPGDGMGTSVRDDLPEKPIYLRLVRTGDEFVSSFRYDGSSWKAISRYKGKFPNRILVGVFAEHDGEDAYEVGFEELTLSQPKK